MIPAAAKDRLVLFIVLAVFIILKIPHLHYAYYWDESIPYAVAIKDLYNHGISLMPNAIDAEISRGHPLFFHAIAAGWMNIFGGSRESMHSFALLISVLFLIAIYESGLRLFNNRVATIALLLVATQEMFFVQSAMVLFEVLVAFLCFLSLIFYVREKYFLTGLCLAMLFYTKESGMIMGFVLGLDALTYLFKKDVTWKERIARIASVGVPTLLIGLYFVIQKHVQGWYIFPFYADLVPHEWKRFWYDVRINCIRSEFYDYLKYCQFLLLVVVAMIASIKQKSLRFLAILPPAICIWYFVDDMRAGRLLPSVPFFIVFILSVIYFTYEYSSPRLFAEAYKRKLIVLTCAFIICFLCFSALNFFTPRYLLASIIPMFFISAVFYDKFISLTWNWLYYVILAGILIINAIAIKTNDRHGDVDLEAFDGLTVHQEVVNYFEKNVPEDAHISSALFLEQKHLTDPATGFLNGNKVFKHVKWEIDDSTQYVISDNIEWDTRYNDFIKDPHFQLFKKITKGKVWAEIYKRK